VSDGGTRRLATVLFTDMVASTEIAAKLGDARWRELLRRHHVILRRDLKRFGGREIDTAGDGVFAIFDVPAQAVRCACTIAEVTQELGVDIRAGLHVGEVEITGREVRGIAVHTGSRVCAIAGPTEVLVTSTLTELVSGSGIDFEDRGTHALKGIPGEWHVFNVTKVAAASRPPPLDAATAEERLALIEPPPFVRRHRGWIATGVALALAAIAVAIAMAPHSPPPPTPPLASLNSLIEIDPTNGKIIKQGATNLSLGGSNFFPLKIAVGEGAVWLLAPPNLIQLDQITGAFRSSIPNVHDFAIGPGAIWVVSGFGVGTTNRLQGIDPATGTVLIRSAGSEPIGASPGAIWASVHGGVDEIDPKTGEHLRHVAMAGASELFATTADVWIADRITDTLTRIDIRSNRGTSQHLAAEPDRIVVGGGYVWVLDLLGGTVTVIDATSGETMQVIRMSAHPTDLAYGLGAVWVPDARNGTITRIDAVTRLVSQIQVGVPLVALAVDDQTASLWAVVANPPPPD
jgi:class 3 adenylate cyclase